MQRRSVLKLFGGLAVGILPRVRAQPRRSGRVVIVGGGIIGASIALHLARRGADVRLLEQAEPAAGATSKSFAWINAGFSKRPRHYYRLNRLSMLAYRHLERELGERLRVKWGGSLRWYDRAEEGAELRRQVRQHQAWGYPVHLVDEDELRRLEPAVVPGTASAAALATQEGSVDPIAVTETLLDGAREWGAQIDYPCEVTGLDLRSGRLHGVRTTCGNFEADIVVIAAGVATPRLAAMAGLDVPLKDSPGVLAHTKPIDRIVDRVILAPGAHMKQMLDGRIVTGAGFGGSPTTDTPREQGERLLDDAERVVPDIKNAELERVTLGWRPLPRDDHPVVGFAHRESDVYLAVMHSGVTLAPLIGRLAAQEILDDVRVELLEPYRLDRFGG